jgi:MoxR-like ATPase
MATATLTKCPRCTEVFDDRSKVVDHLKKIHITKTESVKNAPGTQKEKPLRAYFSEYGREVFEDMKMVHPDPLLLTGFTGVGKSLITRALAADMGLNYSASNAHPEMDISLWVGQWTPENDDGIIIQWIDGVLTQMVRSGGMFLLEEFTRAPQEAMSRLFGLMDDGFRYWSLPEAGGINVPVAENFWLVGTANPTGGGYYTAKIDDAAKRRFVIMDIDKPLADEVRMLEDIFEKGDFWVSKLMKFANELRGGTSHECFINTADLRTLAKLISRGMPPIKAVKYGVAPKYNKPDGIITLAEAHF